MVNTLTKWGFNDKGLRDLRTKRENGKRPNDRRRGGHNHINKNPSWDVVLH